MRRKPHLSRVLDLGKVPAADHFPLATDPVRADEASHALAMDVCRACGLAQLADDDTVTDEPRGVEPQALKDQAEAAIKQVAAAGWLRGDTVVEFGSPHGGTWIPLLAERGFTTSSSQADVVLDCFGIMHEPDQRSAFERRAQVTRPGGVLLLQYHSIVTIVGQGQWNALRHGHFAYYSLTTLTRLLGAAGHAGRHRVGVRPVRRNGVARGRARGGRTGRVRAAHPRDRGCAGHHRARLSSAASNDSADQHVEIATELARRGVGSRPHRPRVRRRVAGGRAVQPRRDRFPVTCGGRRRLARQAGQADAGDRHPDRVAGRTPRGETGSGAADASRSLARGQRAFSGARRSVEGRRPVTLTFMLFHLKGRYPE